MDLSEKIVRDMGKDLRQRCLFILVEIKDNSNVKLGNKESIMDFHTFGLYNTRIFNDMGKCR